ncbi:MAG TPA: hypothetical protein VHD62_15145 [Opitutaceae bacterium]|nr:hypothetical protein [Opitutaceae bacterium]
MKLEITFSTARELLPILVPASPTLIVRGPRARGEFPALRATRTRRSDARRAMRIAPSASADSPANVRFTRA